MSVHIYCDFVLSTSGYELKIIKNHWMAVYMGVEQVVSPHVKSEFKMSLIFS